MKIEKIEEMLAADDKEMVELGIMYLEKLVAEEDWVPILEKAFGKEPVDSPVWDVQRYTFFHTYEYKIENHHIIINEVWQLQSYEKKDKTIPSSRRPGTGSAGGAPPLTESP